MVKVFIANIANYTGPGAILTLLIMWLYIIIKKQKVIFFEYIIYAPALFRDYKVLIMKENNQVKWLCLYCLYYFFFILIILTFISIFASAAP